MAFTGGTFGAVASVEALQDLLSNLGGVRQEYLHALCLGLQIMTSHDVSSGAVSSHTCSGLDTGFSALHSQCMVCCIPLDPICHCQEPPNRFLGMQSIDASRHQNTL